MKIHKNGLFHDNGKPRRHRGTIQGNIHDCICGASPAPCFRGQYRWSCGTIGKNRTISCLSQHTANMQREIDHLKKQIDILKNK